MGARFSHLPSCNFTASSTQDFYDVTITLPEDLLVEILIRVPIKYLLQFRCVSKSCYSLITNPSFITRHNYHIHNNNNTQVNHSLIIQRWNENAGKYRFTLHKDNKSLDWITELDPPIPSLDVKFYRIFDCVCGLVCLLDDCKFKGNIVLWNPLINKVLTLPNPIIKEDDLVESWALGFGFDPMRCDYKVVRIVYGENSSLVEVFRLSSRSWARINGCYDHLPSILPRQAYVNGHVNWVTNGHMILAFDVGNEWFKEIALPKALDEVEVQGLSVVAWNGCLSVLAFPNSGCFGDGHGMAPSGSVSLWVMGENGVAGSWTKRFRIHPYFTQVRGIRTDGKILMESLRGYIGWVDVKTSMFESLQIRAQGTLSALRLESYAESLVLLDVV